MGYCPILSVSATVPDWGLHPLCQAKKPCPETSSELLPRDLRAAYYLPLLLSGPHRVRFRMAHNDGSRSSAPCRRYRLLCLDCPFARGVCCWTVTPSEAISTRKGKYPKQKKRTNSPAEFSPVVFIFVHSCLHTLLGRSMLLLLGCTVSFVVV
jgi:hypothetical protein